MPIRSMSSYAVTCYKSYISRKIRMLKRVSSNAVTSNKSNKAGKRKNINNVQELAGSEKDCIFAGRKNKLMKTEIAKYPEEITDDGLLMYGQTSMDNCLAVLTRICLSSL